MQEGIRNQLPNEPMHHVQRNQCEVIEQVAIDVGRKIREHNPLDKVDCSAGDDQPLHPWGEGREIQRHGTPAIHKSS